MSRRYVIPQQSIATSAVAAPAVQGPYVNSPTQPTPASEPFRAQPTQIVFPWGNPNLYQPKPLKSGQILPSYFRPTLGVFPSNHDVQENVGITPGVVINVAMVENVPIIDYSGDRKIPRCMKCNSYLSPYSKITNDGQGYICPFCGQTSKGVIQPGDVSFTSPVYDIIAPNAFASKPSPGPAFMFVIDLSIEAIASGFSIQMLNSIKTILPAIDDSVRVGLITMGTNISVYDFNHGSVFILTDLADLVIPSNPMAQLCECRDYFNKTIDLILQNAAEEQSPGHCLGSVLLALTTVLNDTGGIVIANCVGAPTIGSFKFGIPENLSQIPEKDLLKIPSDGPGKKFRDIAFRLNRTGLSVHLFTTPGTKQYMNLCYLSALTCLTCGEIHHYPVFDPMKLHNDLYADVTREYFWDSNMRVRVNVGVKPGYISGNITLREQTVCFPIVSSSQNISYEFNMEVNLQCKDLLVQTAILFTNSRKERIIRIFTFSIPTSADVQEVRQSVDEFALMNIMLKRVLFNITKDGVQETAATLIKTTTSMMSKGNKFSSIYYLWHALLSNDILKHAHPYGPDGRMASISQLKSVSIMDLVLFFYPRMIAADTTKTPLPLINESFSYASCFVFHTYKMIYIWISPSISQQFLLNAFGVNSCEDLPTEPPTLGTPENTALQEVLNECYELSGKYLPSQIIKPMSPEEAIFTELMVDVSKVSGTDMVGYLAQIQAAH